MTAGATAVQGILGRHADVFGCPLCRTALTADGASVTCGSCGRAYTDSEGCLDFAPPPIATVKPGHHAPLRLQDPVIARRYETYSRPTFFQIMGGNWGGELTDDAESACLRSLLDGITGPVADVACGAGKWTKVICAAAGGTGQVIGVDLSRPLLTRCRAANPGITAVRGSALALPILSGTLNAAVIWNALQQIPSPDQAIAEAGRCLRPGGVLILLTYRPALDPLDRYFQARHAQAFGVSTFPDSQIRSWLAAGGFDDAEISGPANFLIARASRREPLPAGSGAQ